MTQTLHILRKDLRHLLPEIAASLAILIFFALTEPKGWNDFYGNVTTLNNAVTFLGGVLYISWAVLILRLIHAERLPGINQFWTTRPYEWPSLLAAKCLFLLLIIHLPLLLAQICLLHVAGFAIAPNVVLILHNLLLLTAIFVLPMVCVAIVTTSFAQALLSLLGAGVAAAAGALALSFLGAHSATLGVARYAPLFLVSVEIALTLTLLSAALILQYRRRTTRTTIALVSSTGLLLFLIPLVMKGSAAAATSYPASPENPPASVSIDVGRSPILHLHQDRNPRTAVYFVPLLFSNFSPGAILRRQAMRFTVTAAGGYTWTSQWTYDGNSSLTPKSGSAELRDRTIIDVPWAVHDRIAGSPITLRFDFLTDQLQNRPPTPDTLSRQSHPVAGVGRCALEGKDNALLCRSPFGAQDFISASSVGSQVPCDVREDISTIDPSAVLIPEDGFLMGRYRTSWDLRLSPIVVGLVIFRAPHYSRPEPLYPCPGFPIAFTTEQFQRRLQLHTAPVTLTLTDAPKH